MCISAHDAYFKIKGNDTQINDMKITAIIKESKKPTKSFFSGGYAIENSDYCKDGSEHDVDAGISSLLSLPLST
jgi:flagellar capping protein FliD